MWNVTSYIIGPTLVACCSFYFNTVPICVCGRVSTGTHDLLLFLDKKTKQKKYKNKDNFSGATVQRGRKGPLLLQHGYHHAVSPYVVVCVSQVFYLILIPPSVSLNLTTFSQCRHYMVVNKPHLEVLSEHELFVCMIQNVKRIYALWHTHTQVWITIHVKTLH